MAPVIVLGVGKLYPLHDLGQGNPLSLNEQVQMIGHQHVGVEPKIVSLAVMLDSLQVGGAVLVVSKDVLPLVASGDDMVESALKLNPWFTCHRKNLRECQK